MKFIYKVSASLMFFLSFMPLMAQAPPPPPATPIDGGLSLLLAAGGLYGAKRIRDKIKQT